MLMMCAVGSCKLYAVFLRGNCWTCKTYVKFQGKDSWWHWAKYDL